jgi:superfamily II DNA or RNA helicase
VTSEITYILDVDKSRATGALVLTIASRRRGKEGEWKDIPKPCSIGRDRIPSLPLAEDREILTLLIGGDPFPSYGYYSGYDRAVDSFSLSRLMMQTVLPRVLGTGRCFLPFIANEMEKPPLQWDDGEPWRFVLEILGSPQAGWQLTGHFRRGEQRVAAKEPLLAMSDGILVMRECVAPLVEAGRWIAGLRKNGSISVPEEEREEFFASLLVSPGLPPLDLPEEWKYEEIALAPQPCLRIYRPLIRYARAQERMSAELSFAYQDRTVGQKTDSRGVYDASTRRFILRDPAGEKAAATLLQELGLRCTAEGWGLADGWNFTPSKLPRIVRALVEAGWQVAAEGKAFRQPGKASVSVASGVDWFELQGSVAYGDTTAPLPQLLGALKRGETMVMLDDGSYGLLPEEWLRRFGQVATMGEVDGGHIRFRPSQAGILDALLATQPTVDCDEAFNHVRRELAQFQSIGPAEQPAGFHGCLREYQKEGLGWMHFLRQFSFGGCLADDMGVGKTAQVLALLESRRELRAQAKIDAPSLVVVPKSLIFNWKQESERFTPQLRVLDYTGIARGSKDEFSGYDLILTTYGTLRRDALHFKDKVFDYIILDEAQAIKNEKTESAKAARLLRGNHRLALSGTPVENHLGELWSLFEFLNPGMLGRSGAFALTGASKLDPDGETRKLLKHALRPFLLRRTKEQVAKELPPKVEQTIYCEMEPPQRTLYNELRDHYREALLRKIGAQGIGKSKIQVLEALLRLRQAACHPGLVDRKLVKDPSAKLEILMEQLLAVLDEGHKALVFSQFTSLLAIVRARLAAEGIEYEYLDGKTVNRQARVERFQQDAGCRLFLISLKAGGLGLNLTAADYVFILDPWWNPAVEAQAVDRTHRIGQTRQIFAYRLIARDTVEEKVLRLQETKRNLADAIIGAENSLIREMTREDVELLLS